MKLNERIDYLLKLVGKTQKDLATAINVSEASVSDWINGISSPRPKNLHKVANFLGVTEDWLNKGNLDNIELIDSDNPTVLSQLITNLNSTCNENHTYFTDKTIELSASEKELIDLFRQLDNFNKGKVYGYIESLTQSFNNAKKLSNSQSNDLSIGNIS